MKNHKPKIKAIEAQNDLSGQMPRYEGSVPKPRTRFAEWFDQLRCALERAEKKVMESFRVPPGG